MRRLFDKARQSIAGFLDQRDDLVMIASCSDDDVAVLLKLFQDADQADDADILLLFSDSFKMPGPFVSVVAERLRGEHSRANQLLEEQGRPSLPPIPPVVFNDRQDPAMRLREAISFTRTLLPSGGGNRVVWVLCPLTIEDRPAYFQLLAPLMPGPRIEPWMRSLRLAFRDQPHTEQFAPEFAQRPRVRMMPFDASPAAIVESLEEETRDESISVDERMQALLQLALVDSAHGRTESADEKLQVLLGHYQATNDPAMQALVLNRLGDVCARSGSVERAQGWYECAVVPAGEAQDGVILATIVKNLAALSWNRGDFAAADHYYQGLDQLAARILSPEAKIDALICRGMCQEKLHDWPGAVGSWENAATLGRSIVLPALQIPALEHLERAYQRTGMNTQLSAVRSELAALRSGGAS